MNAHSAVLCKCSASDSHDQKENCIREAIAKLSVLAARQSCPLQEPRNGVDDEKRADVSEDDRRSGDRSDRSRSVSKSRSRSRSR